MLSKELAGTERILGRCLQQAYWPGHESYGSSGKAHSHKLIFSKSHVRGINVLDRERQAQRLETGGDGIFQPWPHVCKDFVATCLQRQHALRQHCGISALQCSATAWLVSVLSTYFLLKLCGQHLALTNHAPACIRRPGALDQRVATALCHHDHGMALRAHQVLRMVQYLYKANSRTCRALQHSRVSNSLQQSVQPQLIPAFSRSISISGMRPELIRAWGDETSRCCRRGLQSLSLFYLAAGGHMSTLRAARAAFMAMKPQ